MQDNVQTQRLIQLKIPQNIIRSISEFPTLPTIYTELTNVMDNPRSTTLDAANIICRDQSSVTKILKAANSSIYGFREIGRASCRERV